MLGRIPQRAPLVKSCMISGSPLFSICIHTRTSAPASGMTAIRPAVAGSFFPIPVAIIIIATLRITLIRICITPLHIQCLCFRCGRPKVYSGNAFNLQISLSGSQYGRISQDIIKFKSLKRCPLCVPLEAVFKKGLPDLMRSGQDDHFFCQTAFDGIIKILLHGDYKSRHCIIVKTIQQCRANKSSIWHFQLYFKSLWI